MIERRELGEERFRTLLLKWLAKLSQSGWEGTSYKPKGEQTPSVVRRGLLSYVPCPQGWPNRTG